MKKILAVLLAATMILSLAACGGGEGIQKAEGSASSESAEAGEEAAEAGESRAVIGWAMTYTSLDPANCYDWDLEMTLHDVYNTLVASDPVEAGKIIPCAASDWTISEDKLTYVFTLKEGIKFTTGKELVADDVVFCLNRVAGIVGNPSFLMETIDSVEATGDYEVTIKLNTVNPAILNILTRSCFSIYDSEVAAANGATCDENDTFAAWLDANPSIGSGAYQIKSFTSGSEVILEKYADSVVKTANVEKIILKNVPDANTQQMELERGDIDFALDLTADQLAAMEGADIQSVPAKTFDLFFLMLNASEEYGKELANPQVREAIKYAIDYEGLCMLAGNNAFVPYSVIPEGFLGYAGRSEVKRDVEKAKQILADAGYPDGFTFECGVIPDMAPDGVGFMMCAEKIAADLAEIGVTMKIASQEVSVYLEGYRDGTQQAVISQWGPDYNDSNSQLAFMPGATVGLRAGWPEEANPELAELGRQAGAEVDDAKRAELLLQVQKDLEASNPPYIVFLQPGRTLATSNRIQNFVPDSTFVIDFTNLELAE